MSNTDRWKPALNKTYYYISGTGVISLSCWGDDYIDIKRYNIGNCFATEKEAKEVAKAWKLFLKNRLVNDYHESKNLKWNSLNASETTKLPNWCKQTEWVFDYNEREYAQVKDIFDDIEAVALTYAGTKERVTKSWKYIVDCCCQAEICPYSAKEMFQLLGKTVSNGTGVSAIVTAHEALHVRIVNAWYNAENLIKYGYTLSDRPCGVLRHLENGKWVTNEQ